MPKKALCGDPDNPPEIRLPMLALSGGRKYPGEDGDFCEVNECPFNGGGICERNQSGTKRRPR